MTDEQKEELEQLQKGWDAKKLSKGKMLRYVYLRQLEEQQDFQDALKDK